MTVAAGVAKAGPYTGNDSASSFAFAFKVFADTDIRVVETLISTEVETDLVLNTNYTVTRNVDQDNSPGGVVTYKVAGVTTALPSTKKLTIVGNFPYEQPADIPDGGAFFASIVEKAIDRVTLLVKQLKEEVERSVKVSVSSGGSPDDLIDSINTAVGTASTASAAAVAAAESATTAAATFVTQANGSTQITKGTTAQRDASPLSGYFRFNTTLGQFEGYNGSAWGSVGGGGATGGGTDKVFVETDQTITTDYTLTANKNAMTAGPVTIADGKTVTIPSGATWTVV